MRRIKYIILSMLVGVVVALAGCAGQYDGMKITIYSGPNQTLGMTSENSLNMSVNEELTISASTSGSEAVSQVAFSSSSNIVSFSDVIYRKGTTSVKIKALSEGTAQIEVRAVDTDVRSYFQVVVTPKITGISLKSDAKLYQMVNVGDFLDISADMFAFLPSGTRQTGFELSLVGSNDFVEILDNRVKVKSDIEDTAEDIQLQVKSTASTEDAVISTNFTFTLLPIIDADKLSIIAKASSNATTTSNFSWTGQDGNISLDGKNLTMTVSNRVSSGFYQEVVVSVPCESESPEIAVRSTLSEISQTDGSIDAFNIELIKTEIVDDKKNFTFRITRPANGAKSKVNLHFEAYYSSYENEYISSGFIKVDTLDELIAISAENQNGETIDSDSSISIYTNYVSNAKRNQIRFITDPYIDNLPDEQKTLYLIAPEALKLSIYAQGSQLTAENTEGKDKFTFTGNTLLTLLTTARSGVDEAQINIGCDNRADVTFTLKVKIIEATDSVENLETYSGSDEKTIDSEGTDIYLSANETTFNQKKFRIFADVVSADNLPTLIINGSGIEIVNDVEIATDTDNKNYYGFTLKTKDGAHNEIANFQLVFPNGYVYTKEVKILNILKSEDVEFSTDTPSTSTLVGASGIVENTPYIAIKTENGSGSTVNYYFDYSNIEISSRDFVVLDEGADTTSWSDTSSNDPVVEVNALRFNQLTAIKSGKCVVGIKLNGSVLSAESESYSSLVSKSIIYWLKVEVYIPTMGLRVTDAENGEVLSSLEIYNSYYLAPEDIDLATRKVKLEAYGPSTETPTYNAIEVPALSSAISIYLNQEQDETDKSITYTANPSEDGERTVTVRYNVEETATGKTVSLNFTIVIKITKQVETLRTLNVDEGGLYFDITDSSTLYDSLLLQTITNENTDEAFNKDLRYFFVADKSEYQGAVNISLTGIISAVKGGKGKVVIIPADQFCIVDNIEQLKLNCLIEESTEGYTYALKDSGIVGIGDLFTSAYANDTWWTSFEVTVADGLSRDTAKRISSLLQMSSQYFHYVLMTNVSVNASELPPCFNNFYGGLYGKIGDGDIRTIMVKGSSSKFFGTLGATATVADIIVSGTFGGNAITIGENSYEGIIANVNNGTIDNVVVDMFVDNDQFVPSSLTSSANYVGGLVGLNNGIIKNSAFIGDIDLKINTSDTTGDPASGDTTGDPASGDITGDPASGDTTGDPASGDTTEDPASGGIAGAQSAGGSIDTCAVELLKYSSGDAALGTKTTGSYYVGDGTGTVTNSYFYNGTTYAYSSDLVDDDDDSVPDDLDKLRGGNPTARPIPSTGDLTVNRTNISLDGINTVDSKLYSVFTFYKAYNSLLTTYQNALISSMNSETFEEVFGNKYVRVISTEPAIIDVTSNALIVKGTGETTLKVYAWNNLSSAIAEIQVLVIYKAQDFASYVNGYKLNNGARVNIKSNQSFTFYSGLSQTVVLAGEIVPICTENFTVKEDSSLDLSGSTIGEHSLVVSENTTLEYYLNLSCDDNFNTILKNNFKNTLQCVAHTGVISLDVSKRELSFMPTNSGNVTVTLVTDASVDGVTSKIYDEYGQVSTAISVSMTSSSLEDEGIYTHKVNCLVEVDNPAEADQLIGKQFRIVFDTTAMSYSPLKKYATVYVNILAQTIQRVDIEHFIETSTAAETGGQPIYGRSSNVLTPGACGCLEISPYPNYIDVAYIDVVSSVNANSRILFNTIDTDTDYSIISNGIRLHVDSDGMASTYRLRTTLPSNTNVNATFSIFVGLYDKDGNLLYEPIPYNIISRYLVGASIQINGMINNMIVANGVPTDIKVTVPAGESFDINTLNFSDTDDFNVFLPSSNWIITNNQDGSIIYSNKVTIRCTVADTVAYLNVSAAISAMINGRLQTRVMTSNIYVVDFVVMNSGNGISHSSGIVNEATAYLNVPHALDIFLNIQNSEERQGVVDSFLKDGTYYAESTTEDATLLSYKIDANPEITTTSTGLIKYLYYSNNNELTAVQEGQAYGSTGSVIFTRDAETGEIFMRGLSTGSVTFRFAMPVKWPYQSNLRTWVEFDFTINVEAYTDEDSPIQITSAEQFQAISTETQSHDYILMQDLVLENFKPFATTNIKSLDGNSKTITIKNFASITEGNTANYALFTEVEESTILKNLSINTYYVRLNINSAVLTEINISGLAVSNNGIITNCEVLAYRPDGEAVTYSQTGLYVTYSGLVGGISLSESVSSRIAGLVIENNGSITNSRVGGTEVSFVRYTNGAEIAAATGTFEQGSVNTINMTLMPFNIKGQGNIAGFVLQNAGIISNSSATNIHIINETQSSYNTITAGFAQTNSGSIGLSSAVGVYSSTSELGASAGGINTATVAVGFVHTNVGDIFDAYTNMPLSSASSSTYLSAGFVVDNSQGKISRGISYSRITDRTTTQLNFCGINNRGDYLEGVLEDCYYYDGALSNLSAEDSVEEYYGSPALSIVYPTLERNYYSFVFASDENPKDGNWIITKTGPKLIQATQKDFSLRYVAQTATNTHGDIFAYVNGYEYGSAVNPIIIRNANEFNEVFGQSKRTPIQAYYDSVNVYGNYRLVNNINLLELTSGTDDSLIELSSSKHSLVNSVSVNGSGIGLLDGNGLTINNLSIAAARTETESFGLFKSIKNGAIVKNLNIVLGRLDDAGNSYGISANQVENVGTLAGYVEDSTVLGVTVTAVTNDGSTAVVGKNIVGGIIGKVVGLSKAVRLLANNVSVTANQVPTISIFNRVGNNAGASFAGGVVGVLDRYSESTIDHIESEYYRMQDNIEPDIANICTFGTSQIKGGIVGGVSGYVGVLTAVKDMAYILADTENAEDRVLQKLTPYTRSGRSGGIAGGVVGENRGLLIQIRSEHESTLQTEIEDNIASYYNGQSTVERGNQTLFISDTQTPYALGGLVGLMRCGKIQYSYSKINVINPAVNYVGGVIGYMDEYTPASDVLVGDVFDSTPGLFEVFTISDVIGTGAENSSIGGVFGYIDDNASLSLDKVNALNYLSISYIDNNSNYYALGKGLSADMILNTVFVNNTVGLTNLNGLSGDQTINYYASFVSGDGAGANNLAVLDNIFLSGGWRIERWTRSTTSPFPEMCFKIIDKVYYIYQDNISDLYYMNIDSDATFVICDMLEMDTASVANFTAYYFTGNVVGRDSLGTYGFTNLNARKVPLFTTTGISAYFQYLAFEGGVSDTAKCYSPFIKTALGGTFESLTFKDISINANATGGNDAFSILAGSLVEDGARIRNILIEDCSIKVNNYRNADEGLYVGFITGKVLSKEAGMANSYRSINIKRSTISLGAEETHLNKNVYAGLLFGLTEKGGNISDVALDKNVSVNVYSNKYAYVGGLIGYIKETVIVSGDIKGITLEVYAGDQGHIGGVAGYIEGNLETSQGVGAPSLTTSSFDLTASGNNINVGGIIGKYAGEDPLVLKGLNAKGDINVSNANNANVGGMIGYAEKITIGDVTSSSLVCFDILALGLQGTINSIGSIIGRGDNATISYVVSGGTIKIGSGEHSVDNLNVGGIAGNAETGTISNCISTTTIEIGMKEENVRDISASKFNNLQVGGIAGNGDDVEDNIALSPIKNYFGNYNSSTANLNAIAGSCGGYSGNMYCSRVSLATDTEAEISYVSIVNSLSSTREALQAFLGVDMFTGSVLNPYRLTSGYSSIINAIESADIYTALLNDTFYVVTDEVLPRELFAESSSRQKNVVLIGGSGSDGAIKTVGGRLYGEITNGGVFEKIRENDTISGITIEITSLEQAEGTIYGAFANKNEGFIYGCSAQQCLTSFNNTGDSAYNNGGWSQFLYPSPVAQTIGGFVGKNEGSIFMSFSHTYLKGEARDNQKIGAFVGDNGGYIESCYTTGSLEFEINGSHTAYAFSNGYAFGCYTAANVINKFGVILTTNSFGSNKNCYSYGSYGDGVGTLCLETEGFTNNNIWMKDSSLNFGYLGFTKSYLQKATGNGTDEPKQILNLSQLRNIKGESNDFALARNINIKAKNTTYLISSFSGTINGNDFSINNLQQGFIQTFSGKINYLNFNGVATDVVIKTCSGKLNYLSFTDVNTQYVIETQESTGEINGLDVNEIEACSIIKVAAGSISNSTITDFGFRADANNFFKDQDIGPRYTGALAGKIEGSATNISLTMRKDLSVIFTGVASDKNLYIGLLVGSSNGATLERCIVESNDGYVQLLNGSKGLSGFYVGGIAGVASERELGGDLTSPSLILQSCNMQDLLVQANEEDTNQPEGIEETDIYASGIVGYSYSSTISECFNEGDIRAGFCKVYNYFVKYSGNNANVFSIFDVNSLGLVGLQYEYDLNYFASTEEIRDEIKSRHSSTENFVSGICYGENGSEIKSCYAIGELSAYSDVVSSVYFLNPLYTTNDGFNYWVTEGIERHVFMRATTYGLSNISEIINSYSVENSIAGFDMELKDANMYSCGPISDSDRESYERVVLYDSYRRTDFTNYNAIRPKFVTDICNIWSVVEAGNATASITEFNGIDETSFPSIKVSSAMREFLISLNMFRSIDNLILEGNTTRLDLASNVNFTPEGSGTPPVWANANSLSFADEERSEKYENLPILMWYSDITRKGTPFDIASGAGSIYTRENLLYFNHLFTLTDEEFTELYGHAKPTYYDEDLERDISYREANYNLARNVTCGFSWQPIENFSSTFNGNNKTIFNLYIYGNSNLGLFSIIDDTHTIIKNLNLSNIKLYADVGDGIISSVGILAGRLNKGTITNVSIRSSKISVETTGATTYVGGMIGAIDGGRVDTAEISGCSVFVNNKNSSNSQDMRVGGAVGMLTDGIAYRIKSAGTLETVDVKYTSGGIGYMSGGSAILECTGGKITTYTSSEDPILCGAAYAEGPYVIGETSILSCRTETQMGGFVITPYLEQHSMSVEYHRVSNHIIGMSGAGIFAKINSFVKVGELNGDFVAIEGYNTPMNLKGTQFDKESGTATELNYLTSLSAIETNDVSWNIGKEATLLQKTITSTTLPAADSFMLTTNFGTTLELKYRITEAGEPDAEIPFEFDHGAIDGGLFNIDKGYPYVIKYDVAFDTSNISTGTGVVVTKGEAQVMIFGGVSAFSRAGIAYIKEQVFLNNTFTLSDGRTVSQCVEWGINQYEIHSENLTRQRVWAILNYNRSLYNYLPALPSGYSISEWTAQYKYAQIPEGPQATIIQGGEQGYTAENVHDIFFPCGGTYGTGAKLHYNYSFKIDIDDWKYILVEEYGVISYNIEYPHRLMKEFTKDGYTITPPYSFADVCAYYSLYPDFLNNFSGNIDSATKSQFHIETKEFEENEIKIGMFINITDFVEEGTTSTEYRYSFKADTPYASYEIDGVATGDIEKDLLLTYTETWTWTEMNELFVSVGIKEIEFSYYRYNFLIHNVFDYRFLDYTLGNILPE